MLPSLPNEIIAKINDYVYEMEAVDKHRENQKKVLYQMLNLKYSMDSEDNFYNWISHCTFFDGDEILWRYGTPVE